MLESCLFSLGLFLKNEFDNLKTSIKHGKAQVTEEENFTTAELMTVQIAQLISLKLLKLVLTEDIQIGTAETWQKYKDLPETLKIRYKSVAFTGKWWLLITHYRICTNSLSYSDLNIYF